MSRRSKLPLFDADLDAQAQAFHEANPDVYRLLRSFACEAKRAGEQRLGIAALFERLRWYTAIETRGDRYRINNSFRAFYARKLMAEEPELAGLFVTRAATFDPDYHARPRRGVTTELSDG